MADRVETIGIYSAYGFAKEAGYTGTKAEFEQGLKNSAEYADNAASSANAATNAKNAAVTAKTDAQAAQSAAETAQGLAEDAQAAAEEAKNDAEAAAASLDASTIARIDGFYENMGVGTADQLMASQKVHNSDPYIFRTSGGTSDIGNREELEIVGGSIVWNQLYKFVSSRYTDKGLVAEASEDRSTITINGTTTGYGGGFGIRVPNIKDHVYYIHGHLSDYTNLHFTSQSWGDDTGNGKIIKSTSENEYWFYVVYIKQPVGTVIENVTARPQVFNLTAMFGSEIADHIYELEQAEAGAGVAWFRKYFPNEYYDYNAGELMHVSDLQSHDTVGFNLFDKNAVKKNNRINTETGVIEPSSADYMVSDYIPVKCGKTVYIPNTNSSRRWFYSTDKTPVMSIVGSNLFTPPSDGFIAITIVANVNIDDICINLSWSGTRDGEYEPHVKHSYPLDPSLTLRGIPKLTADGDLTYDGDIYKPDGTVERRYGIVDLGTLNWSTSASQLFLTDSLANLAKHVADSKNAGNILSTNHVTRDTLRMHGPIGDNPSNDKEIGINQNGRVFVNDFSYTDAATFKAAMSGVYLVYELAEPTTEEAEPYTSPQIVDDWGTEEFVTTSIVPVGHNTSYPANLRDKLQHLPDLPDDDGYYMTQVDGTQMSLTRFRIPQAPAEDGEYILKATVSNGTPIYTWEAVVEAEGGEG